MRSLRKLICLLLILGVIFGASVFATSSTGTGDDPFSTGKITGGLFPRDNIVQNYILKSSFYVCDNSQNDTDGEVIIGVIGPTNSNSSPYKVIFKDTIPAGRIRVIIYDVGSGQYSHERCAVGYCDFIEGQDKPVESGSYINIDMGLNSSQEHQGTDYFNWPSELSWYALDYSYAPDGDLGHYERHNYRLYLSSSTGVPGILKGYANRWTIQRQGHGGYSTPSNLGSKYYDGKDKFTRAIEWSGVLIKSTGLTYRDNFTFKDALAPTPVRSTNSSTGPYYITNGKVNVISAGKEYSRIAGDGYCAIIYTPGSTSVPECNVTVKYNLYENGRTIKSVPGSTPINTTVDKGASYPLTKQSFSGYEFVEATKDGSTFTFNSSTISYDINQDTEFILYYKAIPTPTCRVTVKYNLYENGRTTKSVPGSTPIDTTVNKGTSYTITKPSFTGYEFVEATKFESIISIGAYYIDKDTEFTLYYKLIPTPTCRVTVNYYLYENGRTIKSVPGSTPINTTVNKGESYTITKPYFEGYEFVESTKNGIGINIGESSTYYIDEDTVFNLYYKKETVNVTVNYYLYENGRTTKSVPGSTPIDTTVNKDTSYTITKPSFAGYEFVESTKDEIRFTIGESSTYYIDKDTEFILYYKKTSIVVPTCRVTVNYYLYENGRTTKSVPGSTPINTTVDKGGSYKLGKKSFTGYTFVEATKDGSNLTFNSTTSSQTINKDTTFNLYYESSEVPGGVAVYYRIVNSDSYVYFLPEDRTFSETLDVRIQRADKSKLPSDKYRYLGYDKREGYYSRSTPYTGIGDIDADKRYVDNAVVTLTRNVPIYSITFVYEPIVETPKVTPKCSVAVKYYLYENGRTTKIVPGSTPINTTVDKGASYTLTKPSFVGYEFVEATKDGSKFTFNSSTKSYDINQNTEFILYYKTTPIVIPTCRVTVNYYLYENGRTTKIVPGSTPINTTVNKNSSYTITKPSFTGYEFVEATKDEMRITIGESTAYYIDKDTEFILYYKLLPIPTCRVTVNYYLYVNGRTSTPVPGSSTINETAVKGSTYKLKKEYFDKYEFVEATRNGNAFSFPYIYSDFVIDEDTTFNLYYKEKLQPVNVTVNYYLYENGRTTKPVPDSTPINTTVNKGESYIITKQSFAGYEFVESTKDGIGINIGESSTYYIYEDTVFNLYYKKETVNVTVNYYLYKNNQRTTERVNGCLPINVTIDKGSNYSVPQKYFTGYEYYEATKNGSNITTLNNHVINENTTFNLYYKESGTVKVRYYIVGEAQAKFEYSYTSLSFEKHEFLRDENKLSVDQYTYLGYSIESGKISTLRDYTGDEVNLTKNNTASVELDSLRKNYVITFVYKPKINLNIKIKHVTKDGDEIPNSEKMYTLGVLANKLNTNDKQEFYGILEDSSTNDSDKLIKCFKLFDEKGIWNPDNLIYLKSIPATGMDNSDFNGGNFKGYRFINNTADNIEVKLERNGSKINTGYNSSSSGNTLYYFPKLDGIKSVLSSAQDGDTLVITMKYAKNGTIRVNYVVRGLIKDFTLKDDCELNESITIKPEKNFPGNDLEKYSVQDGLVSKKENVKAGDQVYNNDEGVSVTLSADNREKTVNFFFMPPPDIEVGIDTPQETEVVNPPGGEGTTPETAEDSKILVLDEKFKINWNIVEISEEGGEPELYNGLEPGDEVIIKFPFDVYYKNEFKKADNDILLMEYNGSNRPTGEQIVKEEFRLPSWVVEKQYDNTKIWIQRGNSVKNSKTIKITVVGRLYDFSVININGDNEWSNSMFAQQQKSNPNLQYKADTLPIGQKMVTMKEKATTGRTVSVIPQNGEIRTQNTTYPYGMKLGSSFVFSINTKGLYSEKIQITPRLKYYALNANKDGYEEKTDVKFVYKVQGKGEVDFAGSDGIIKISGAYTAPLNKYKGVSAEFSDDYNRTAILKGLAKLWNENENELNYRSLVNAYSTFAPDKYGNSYFGYDGIKLEKDLRLAYANYASSKNQLSEVQWIGKDDVLPYVDSNTYTRKAGEVGMYEQNGITDSRIINSLGHWYAEYKLPASLQVKESRQLTGIDDKANIMKGGFIVVEFEIKSLHTDSNGNDIEYLKYKDTQWNAERDNNSNEITINFPATSEKSEGATGDYEIEGDYYPVAIYDVKTTTNIAEQTAMIK